MNELFIDNKYRRWYFQIVDRARGRALVGYVERHHVLPRSLGGKRSETVRLTYREHFVVHWLLTKCTDGDAQRKMKRALMAMTWRSRTHKRIVCSRQYAAAKRVMPELGRLLGRLGKGKPKTDEHRKKIADALRGKVKSASHIAKLSAHSPSAEHRRQISAKLTGRVYSSETLARMRAANTGRPHTAESRSKMSAVHRGHAVSEECRARISAANKGRKRGPHSMEHCAKIGAAARKRKRDNCGRWVDGAVT